MATIASICWFKMARIIEIAKWTCPNGADQTYTQ